MGALRDRFDIVPGEFRPNTVRIGVIACVCVGIFLFTIYTRPSVPILSGSGMELTGEFPSGTNVRPGYTPVRIRGIDVGQVTEVERAPSGRGALVTVEIDDDTDVELKQDMRMALRWRTLLGRNIYVDIDPGSTSAPEWSGGVVPRSRTQDQVELDTTLEPLDAKGRSGLQTMITEFDDAFANPADVRRTVDEAAPAARNAALGLPALRGERPGDLPRLVANASRALGELSRDEVSLGRLVTAGAGALGVTAARRADLAATLTTAPETMRETRTTLVRLEATLDELDPLADELQPGLESLAPAADRTRRALSVARPLISDLEPTLAALRPALTDLREASEAGVPALGPLNETMASLESDIVPFLKAEDPATKRPNYTNIGPVASHAGSAASWGDRYGAVANFEATVGEDAFDTPCKLELFNPDVSTQEKIKCDLFSIALGSALLGREPQDLRLGQTAAPKKLLTPFIEGTKKLKLPGLENLIKEGR